MYCGEAKSCGITSLCSAELENSFGLVRSESVLGRCGLSRSDKPINLKGKASDLWSYPARSRSYLACEIEGLVNRPSSMKYLKGKQLDYENPGSMKYLKGKQLDYECPKKWHTASEADSSSTDI